MLPRQPPPPASGESAANISRPHTPVPPHARVLLLVRRDASAAIGGTLVDVLLLDALPSISLEAMPTTTPQRLYRLIEPLDSTAPVTLLGPGYQPYWMLPPRGDVNTAISQPQPIQQFLRSPLFSPSGDYGPATPGGTGGAEVTIRRALPSSDTSNGADTSSGGMGGLRYDVHIRDRVYRWKKPAFSAQLRCELRAVGAAGELVLAFDTAAHPLEARYPPAASLVDPSTPSADSTVPPERIGVLAFPWNGPLHRRWSELEESALVATALLVIAIARGERPA